MKRRSPPTMWFLFVAIIFGIITLVGLIFFGLLFFAYRRQAFAGPPHISPLLFVLAISILIGSVISILVGRYFLKPVLALNEAMKRVSKGDFEVRLPEKGRTEELRLMARNFNNMVADLASIETLRTDFVVNVSHELKTPISTVEGYATLLQDADITAQERKEYAGMILSSTHQLSSLVGNILRLSRLENQEYTGLPTRFRLDEQIRQALLLLEKQWASKHIELNLELGKLWYTGHEQYILLIWLNVLGNAFKFTPDYGEVRVTLEADESYASVIITDNGAGMPEETVRHIFDKFYQGDRTRATEGNGLGLSLVKRILDLCGGEIAVKSEAGAGSEFLIRLPLHAD